MKKTGLLLMAAALCMILLSACGGNTENSAADSGSVSPVASPSGSVSAGIAGDNNAYISEQAAQEAALAHAGIAQEDAQFISVRLEYDDGRAEYDVKFVAGNEEYDYDLDALTGDVLAMERESYRQTASGGGDYIGEAAARKTALEHAGLSESEATFIKTALEMDDGRWVYEVEFYQGSVEYDYTLDALSGEILAYDYDVENFTAPAGSAGDEMLDAQEAKRIALQHAGVSESDASRMELELDYEHGRAIYEIEWKVGWTEYSYEIDAYSGDVLAYEREQD